MKNSKSMKSEKILNQHTIKKIHEVSDILGLSDENRLKFKEEISFFLEKTLTDHFILKISTEHTIKKYDMPTEENIDVWNDELITYNDKIYEIISKLFYE